MSKKDPGPKFKKNPENFNYRDILQRKAEQGDKRAKQVLKELGTRNMFDNYHG